MKRLISILSGYRAPSVEVTRIELLAWAFLCTIFILVLASGDSNGIGIYQKPEQDLFIPLTIGTIVNSLVISIIGVRLVPYYYSRQSYLSLIWSLSFLLIGAVLLKSFIDNLLTLTIYPELQHYPFSTLMEDNLYFTASAFVLGLPYGIFKSLVYRGKLPPEEVMVIPSGKKLYRFKKMDIDYFEAKGSYVKVAGRFKPELMYTSLNVLEKQIDSRYFMRVHSSYIVALNNAMQIDSKQVSFQDIRIPVGKKYQRQIHKVLTDQSVSSAKTSL